MSPIDDELTTLALTSATHPVPQVREAAQALMARVRSDGPIKRHLADSIERLSRDYGWEIAQEASFLVRDMQLARRAGAKDASEMARRFSWRRAA